LISAAVEESNQKWEALMARQHESMEREHALVIAALQEQLTAKIEKDRSKIVTSNQVLFTITLCFAFIGNIAEFDVLFYCYT